MKITEEQRFKLMQEVSGQYLTDYLPNNFMDMEEEEQNDFLYQNAWQPLEDMGVSFVFEMIDDTTDAMVRWIEENL